MFIYLNGLYYNLSIAKYIRLNKEEVIMYFNDGDTVLIQNLPSNEITLIKKFLNGRNS